MIRTIWNIWLFITIIIFPLSVLLYACGLITKKKLPDEWMLFPLPWILLGIAIAIFMVRSEMKKAIEG